MTNYYPITGIPSPDGKPWGDNNKPPIRFECDTWYQNKPIQVSLFIQALQRFYDLKNSNEKSFFNIAGIHGFPATKWDNAPPPNAGRWYCTHNTVTFPTWHRPYMLLFEQRIYEHMLDVITDLNITDSTELATWKTEATNWRLPYFDWGLEIPDANGVPILFTQKQLNLAVPKNHAALSVDNPLWSYRFRDEKGVTSTMGSLGIKYNGGGDWSETTGTSRYGIFEKGDSYTGLNGVNNYRMSAAEINTPDSGYHVSDIVYRLFTNNYFKTWKTFSSTIWLPGGTRADWKQYGSLEQIHNYLHGKIGGGNARNGGAGHMSDPAVAAFDPIFYMHHNNIDRQLAIWQVLNPTKWFDQPVKGDPKPTDPLAPFHMRPQTGPVRLYQSQDIVTWTALGYEFDILAEQTGEKKGTAQYVARVRADLGKAYQNRNTGDALLAADDSLFGTETPSALVAQAPPPASAPAALVMQEPAQITRATDSAQEERKVFPDYLLNVVYDRFALAGEPYSVHFFLGEVSEAELASTTTPITRSRQHVGTVYNFSSPVLDHCGNCAQQVEEGVLSSASLPITVALLEHARDNNNQAINAIDANSVETYLADYLHWRVVSGGGEFIDPQRVPKTRVFALKGAARHYPEPERLSEYGEYSLMPDATRNKPLGATAAQYDNPAQDM